ncbi:DUF1223 domain-containing protein [Anaeromyxobacter oryzae]|uniref:DUF1223 domain-containing protein n=1 Tax=Anaeromyxobacter oryzae TaxID=2918170 RepID=A0ABN6MXF0_9BACT|nr:DUF1223 domain-containing protein [Anaeromyxobacter oryzae]BDG05629.1 hypothetical protein AMOR_46250 [Anaeromyxobacter oryzae]
MSRLLVPLLLLTAASRGSPALAPAVPNEAVVLVELFTSEGCSSCPPADALLAELADERASGSRIVALSEHVDYWDGPDWRDRFSSPVFTQRQQAYARRLGLSSVYTPQLVVAGRTDVLGSDRRAARAAIALAAREPSGRVAARIVSAAAAKLSLRVDATWSGSVPADVLVAVVQDRATTRVAGGENAGRTIEHVAVARSLTAVGSGAGAFSGSVTLALPDANRAGHVVVFVQEREGGPVLGASTVLLP